MTPIFFSDLLHVPACLQLDNVSDNKSCWILGVFAWLVIGQDRVGEGSSSVDDDGRAHAPKHRCTSVG
eukprot:2864939-Pleurochrysis_carterae.AAC.2